jgi:hypothetical protein
MFFENDVIFHNTILIYTTLENQSDAITTIIDVVSTMALYQNSVL